MLKGTIWLAYRYVTVFNLLQRTKNNSTFVNVAGISASRVTIVNKRRAVTQTSILETELQIAPGTFLNARYASEQCIDW